MNYASTLCLLAAVSAGCSAAEAMPAGQVLVWVTTDAPVPEAVPRSDSTPPLFDRLLVDFYPPLTGTSCVTDAGPCELPQSRQLAIDEKQIADGLSFGVALPPNVEDYLVRARLYSSVLNNGKLPQPRNVIDSIITLPAVPAEGQTISIAIVLRVDNVGIPAYLDQAQAPTLGGPPPNLVGTWPGAARVPCSGQPHTGEVCVPGGAFWMGLPDMLENPLVPDNPSARLVQLSPFYMDATEVTVQQLVDSDLALPDDPIPWNPNPFSRSYYSTWAPDDAEGWPYAAKARDMPVSGATQELARAYCQTLGGDLPSEAQFEYVSGGLANRMFIWGNDDPTCADAMWGRAGVGILTAYWGDCLTPDDATSGPRPPRSGKRDVLTLEGGSIYDIAGNLLEWTRDVWSRQDETCWADVLMRDPVCPTPSKSGAIYSVRGGGWPLAAEAMRPPARLGLDPLSEHFFSPAIGFRCVRPG